MDLMMLNGSMEPDDFAKPLSIPIERLARHESLPADPRFGLCGNLLNHSVYQKPVKMTIEDEALLLNIEAESKTALPSIGSISRSAKGGVSGLPPPRRRAIAPAPWMRRMSYDEYFGRSQTQPRSTALLQSNGLTQLKQSKGAPKRRATASPMKPKSTLGRTFTLAGKKPVHPDRRKKHLKPISVTPLFPDFSTLGEEFISMQFDRNMHLTHHERRSNPDMYKKAAMNMATISLAGEDDKKFLASYTPSDDAYQQLTGEKENDDEKPKVYEWVSEYGIVDTGKYGLTGINKKGASKHIYAVRKFQSDDGKKSVATLSKVAVSWKLRQRVSSLPKLGKPHLKIEVLPFTKNHKDEKLGRAMDAFEKRK